MNLLDKIILRIMLLCSLRFFNQVEMETDDGGERVVWIKFYDDGMSG